MENFHWIIKNINFGKAAKKDGVCMWGGTSDLDTFHFAKVEMLIFQLIQL